MNAETLSYLSALFSGKAETDYILIWSKQGEAPKSPNLSRWAKTVEEAAKAVEAAESEDGWHVYAGVCPRPKEFGRNKRGLATDISALLALWVDIDIGEVGHKSKRNPRTEAEALELLAKFPLPASLVTHTGGGLHGYWILKEGWQFGSDAERAEAAALVAAFQKTLQIHAAASGLSVDSTFDLTRVLRIPGTTNWKGETPRLCRILSETAARYDPGDIRDALPPEAWTVGSAKAEVAKQIAGLVLDPKAMPPQDKFEALRLAEPKFDASVKYERRDLKDDTPSGYDMSLAATAAYAGWTEQEIADLLIFVRTLHGQKLRLDDARYYVRTINLAIADAQRRNAMEELRGDAAAKKIIDRPAMAEATAEATAEGGEGRKVDPEAKRNKTLEAISRAFGCRIKGIIKYAQDPPRYRMETGKGGIELGTVDNLIGQPQIRNALAATDSHMLPKFKAEDWEAIAQMLLDCCRVVTTGAESTNQGAIREWLNVYFDDNPPAGEASEQSIANQQPHSEGEYICFYLSHFQTWLYQRRNQAKKPAELGIMLRLIRARDGSITYKPEGGKRTTRAVWRVRKPGQSRDKAAATPKEGDGKAE